MISVHRGAAALLLGALCLAGCASTRAAQAPQPPVSASPSSPSPSPRQVTLDEHASGTTVTLLVGSTLQITLHSTYWKPPTSSAVAVLRPLGPAVPAVTPTASGCHPGSGCGTLSAGFTALRSGTVTVTASRTSCGEAMACTPAQRTFTVTVQVTGR
ncbi:hypothetical protein EDD99_0417 [Streptomyces sp. 846.5]|nr:hypothetical protein [Streptomyces sp. 846.5]TDU02032.1 hypothetical protein EDD99_0417 [Streptomyces sp. 846.5]